MKSLKKVIASVTEVRPSGIVIKLNIQTVQDLLFYGILLGVALMLAVEGELIRTILIQVFVTAVIAWASKGNLG